MSPKSLERAIAKMQTMTPEQLKKHHQDAINSLKLFNRIAPWLIILIFTVGIVVPLIANNVK